MFHLRDTEKKLNLYQKEQRFQKDIEILRRKRDNRLYLRFSYIICKKEIFIERI